MRYSTMATVAVLSLASAAQAGGQAASVVRDSDASLTCSQMADEAAELSASMGQGQGVILGRVGSVARAGAAMLVPGAALALAGADAVTARGRGQREAETDARRDRWNYLNGLYAGKACGRNRDEQVAQEPAVTPVPAADPVVTITEKPRIAPSTLPPQVQALRGEAVPTEQGRNESGPNR